MSDLLTLEHFTPHVGKTVRFKGTPFAFPIDRVEGQGGKPPPGWMRVPFTVIFRGPRDRDAVMAEGQYDCEIEGGPDPQPLRGADPHAPALTGRNTKGCFNLKTWLAHVLETGRRPAVRRDEVQRRDRAGVLLCAWLLPKAADHLRRREQGAGCAAAVHAAPRIEAARVPRREADALAQNRGRRRRAGVLDVAAVVAKCLGHHEARCAPASPT